MGGGAAFLDYDGDGDQDLLFVNSDHWPDRPLGRAAAAPRALPQRRRRPLQDVTAAAGLDQPFYGMGVAVGDYDNDGDPDLFLTAVGGDRFFAATTAARFVDVTDEAGVAGDRDGWSTAARFFDIDNDGDLDLFVCNYVRWSAEIDREVDFRLVGRRPGLRPADQLRGRPPLLYRNDGAARFTDVSAEAGVQVATRPDRAAPVGKALGVGAVDVDGDGWSTWSSPTTRSRNFLFHNRGDGTFEEVGAASGIAFDRVGSATGAMGIDSADFRNDGALAWRSATSPTR